METLMTLFSSRKFLTSAIAMCSVLGVVYLRATGKIPADAMIPTITAMTTAALGLIGATAYEDGQKIKQGQIPVNPRTIPPPPLPPIPTSEDDLSKK